MNKYDEILKQYKSLFPEDIEAIVLTKENYDNYLGIKEYENIQLKQKIEELEEYIEELKEEIKIKNRTICHQSTIIMNANEYLENYSNGEFDFDKLTNILKGEE